MYFARTIPISPELSKTTHELRKTAYELRNIMCGAYAYSLRENKFGLSSGSAALFGEQFNVLGV